MRDDGREDLDHAVQVFAFHRGDDGGRRLEGHGLEIQLRHRFEQLRGDELGAADAGRADVELAWVRLGGGDEFLYRLVRRVGVEEQRKTEETDRRYRREIADRVVRQRLE